MKRHHSIANAGFTLIEALVALLVLSIGLLGVAAMQLEALKGAHAAYQRSIASLAAQDAQERLWSGMATVADLTCPAGTGVNGADHPWATQWENFLPGLNANPIGTPTTDCEFSITVEWEEERLVGGQEPFIYTVKLPTE